MVRGGSSWWRRAGSIALAALAATACSGDGDDGGATDDTQAEGGPVTVPDDVEAGLGYLVLDGEPTLLLVRSCTLEPAIDPTTGVTTELAIDADDAVSLAVSITRSSFAGDLPTTTDEILVARDNVLVLESERADRDGTILDVRAPGSLRPLLEVDGTLVTASGVFGPTNSREGDAGLVEGSLTIRCP